MSAPCHQEAAVWGCRRLGDGSALVIIINCSDAGELCGEMGKGKADVIVTSGPTLATGNLLTRFFIKDSLAWGVHTLERGFLSWGHMSPMGF